MTLTQGLAEYFATNPGLDDVRAMSSEAAAFFRRHDAVHVVYGCDMSLDDEVVVKIASVFGTTAGVGALKGYRLHESMRIYTRLRIVDMLGTAGRSVVVVPRTIARCLSQRARWPWASFEPYLDEPLQRTRATFGITVAHCGTSAARSSV